MKRTLNGIGALIFIGLGLFFLFAWLTGDEATTQRVSSMQYSQFIAAAFCLSVGTVMGWRATRQLPANQSTDHQADSRSDSPTDSPDVSPADPQVESGVEPKSNPPA